MSRLFFRIFLFLLLFSPAAFAQTVKNQSKKVETVDIFDELKRQGVTGQG